MRFREFILNEIGEQGIETRRGYDLLDDPAMEIAMYVLYRHAYDAVSARDFGQAWSFRSWKKPSTGGTRAPAWVFTGVFPTESDLEIIRQQIDSTEDVQTLAEKILSSGVPNLSRYGGISWRDDKHGVIKLTGMWGTNNIAKLRAGAEIVHKANIENKEIFTGADSALKDLLNRAEKSMPRFHKMGMVPSPKLGLTTPPKEIVPLLYDIITSNPAASGGGSWTGINPETGALKYNLSGTGEREKFIYGNPTMWRNGISKALSKIGIQPEQIEMGKKALRAGGIMASMAASHMNKALRNYFPNVSEISPLGLLWLLDHV
jgi:hypothetical protein